jgi:hypothetical protein
MLMFTASQASRKSTVCASLDNSRHSYSMTVLVKNLVLPKRLELNQSDTELVPIDIYARSIDSPMRNMNFELGLVRSTLIYSA